MIYTFYPCFEKRNLCYYKFTIYLLYIYYTYCYYKVTRELNTYVKNSKEYNYLYRFFNNMMYQVWVYSTSSFYGNENVKSYNFES